MEFRFATVDVFTAERFGGNPLAVLPEAAGLTTPQMQCIAMEFNLSETTFVLPPKSPDHTAEVRIFTPRAELPFAGHPNIGTAFVLARRGEVYGRAVGEPLVFEEKAGLVPIDLMKDDDGVVGARLAAPQPLARGATVAVEIVAAACGLEAEDIETARHAPCTASAGIPFVFAEVKGVAALGKAVPRGDVFGAHLGTGIHLYTRTDEAGIDIQSRMFAPHHGVVEDPATGSANIALIGLLAALRPEADLSLAMTIAQGREMGRPSLLDAAAEKRGGTVTGLWIGGRCVEVMQGVIDVG